MAADLSPELKTKISSIIASDEVVLFMKGTRSEPRCGFSAAVVGILDEVGLAKYRTVDVLADPEIREGIKVYSDWPTIPQLYIKGELIGGADITKEMYAKGDLHKKLGLKASSSSSSAAAPVSVSLRITPAAANVLKQARDAQPADNRFLRIAVNARFQHQLGFSPKNPSDSVVETEGLTVVVDAASAARANGLSIDAVPQANGQMAFRIENPNEPPRVKDISARELKAKMDAGKIELFDVRNEGERAMAKIEGARLFDDDARSYIASLPKDTPLFFHCHHGGRSERAAESFVAQGWKSVFNLAGGIDAWAVEVDPSIKRY